MPRTTAETNRDIDDIKSWITRQEGHNAKVDTLLETLVKQNEKLDESIGLFRDALNELKAQMNTTKVLITGGGFVATAVISGLVGHFIGLIH